MAINNVPINNVPINNVPLILTRFLYSKDEVELSLLTALLKNENIQIVYYWAYELYYSGFDVFELLWKIYLDFYYEQQPYFVTYFKKKHSLWKLDGSMVHIAYIVRNMYALKPSCIVFMMRQYMDKENTLYPTIMYKVKEGLKIADTKLTQWLQLYDIQYHNLLMSMERRHYDNICYYLRKLEKDSKLYDVVLSFLGYDVNSNDIDNMHYLLAFIVRTLHIDIEHDALVKKHVYVVPKQEHLDHNLLIEEEQIPLSKYGSSQTYNTLMHKRYVSIDDFVGSFDLARFKWSTHEEFINELYFHWEYYAMGSPLWLKRLHDFGGNINHTEKKIQFVNEEGEEGFYNLYAYELDELPKEVQEMSMKRVNNTDGKTWYKHIFQEHIFQEPMHIIQEPMHIIQELADAIADITIDVDEDYNVWKWTY
jgi:hypothetical protein